MRVLILCLCLFITHFAHSQSDPNIEWRIMRLPHFDLIFDAKHQEIANSYAAHLEDIVATLGKVFTEIPEKTLLVINDKTDLTNGYATAIPYPLVVVYPVLPGPTDSIYEHGIWSRELIMHEYTHILSFEPRRGVVKVLHSALGSIITPNILLPRWWLEGVAVEMETRQSPYGRLRSPAQDAALRSYIQYDQHTNLDLASINEVAIPTWPGGARPYIFGSLMWSQMIHDKDLKVVETLHQSYGGRVPFFIESPALEFVGSNYYEIFDKMTADLRARVLLQIQKLNTLPLQKTENFTTKTIENFSPLISPDGTKMIYLVKDETMKRSIRILQRPNLNERFSETQELGKVSQKLNEQGDAFKPIPGRIDEDGPPAGTITRCSWFPDSEKFLFDKVADLNLFHETSDLWTYDLRNQKIEQLTHGLRAREPSISPDGKRVVFIKLGPGTTEVASLNLAEPENVTTLYRGKMLTTLSFPTFVDNNQLIFTERLESGEEHALLFDLSTQQTRQVLADYFGPRLFSSSPKGILFVSSQNGVPNLYLAHDNFKKVKPLSHSATAISVSAYDESLGDVYLTELTDKGNQLHILSKPEIARIEKASLPKVTPLYEDRYPVATQKETLPPRDLVEKYSPEAYHPSEYLWPHYWLPSFYADSTKTYISANTSGHDPVGIHSYSAMLAYDSSTREGNYSLLYFNQSFWPSISFSALDNKVNVPMTALEFRRQWESLESAWELPSLNTDLFFLAGWDWRSNDFTGASRYYANGPSLGMKFSDFLQSGAQISPESGTGLHLLHTSYLRGNDHDSFEQTRINFVKYFSRGLPSRHAIMARVQGQLIEQPVNLAHYDTTVSFLMYNNPLFPSYIMRGYPPGEFLGKSILNWSLEYRFPLVRLYRGAGTTPLYLKQLHAALIADGIQLDGYAFRPDFIGQSFPYEAVPKWKNFTNYGLELKLDITLGYHLPMTLYGGWYWASETAYQASTSFVMGLMM